MSRIEEIIVEHTRLAREHAELSVSVLKAKDVKEFEVIQKRKAEIKVRIQGLKTERIALCGK